VLKAITGQDPLRNEQKHKQQGTGFVPTALVLVAANEAIQSNDYTSGLERRRLTIPFLNQVAASQRRDLLTITGAGMSGEFVDCLPGLLNWVLALPDATVRELLVNTPVSVPSLAQWKAESLLESNPIAEWLDNRIIIDAGEKTYVGYADKIRETSGEPGNNTSRDRYVNRDRWLYASYVQYCHQVGNRPISLKRFVVLLEDLLRSQLGIPIARGKDVKGSYFAGIALRSHSDDALPRPITKDSSGAVSVTDDLMGADGSLTAESTGNDGFDGYDGLSEIDLEETLDAEGRKEVLDPSLDSEAGEKESNRYPSHPSNPSLPDVSAITSAITTAATTHHLPKLPHALVEDRWRDDSDPFWDRLETSPEASTVTRKNRALQIRNEWLAAKSADELKQLKQQWIKEAKFVWNRVLTCAEQRQLEGLSQSQQTSIDGLDLWNEV
jgi:putative DNA primase/helicase